MAIKTLSPILPIREVPEISKIEQINPVQAKQPLYGFSSIQAKKETYYRHQKQIETFLSDYNDPTELNSYIDALTNREAVSKKFGEAWGTISTASGVVSVLSFAGSIIAAALAPFTGGASLAVAAPLAKVGAIAAIPAIPAAVDVTVEKGIKPIIAGKPKEALLNTMMNLGETMDFVANPVKGLFIEGPEGFIKGSGLSSEGRVNYDYDTGFFLSDMLLETISDPLNWVSFGTSAGLKTATTTVAKEATQQVVDTAVTTVNKTLAKSFGEITAEGAERISKQITKTTAQVSKEWAAKSFEKLTAAAKDRLLRDGRERIQRSLVQAIRKELPEATADEIDLILRKVSKHTAKQQIDNYFMKEISDITFDTLSTDVIKNLAGIQYYSDAFQKFMTKGAMLSSGYGLGVEAAKIGWKGIKAWANNFTLNKLKRATVFDNMNGLDIKQYTKAKGIWEASYKYTSDLTGDISQRDMNSFYTFMQQQLNRDKQLISDIMRDGNKPLTKAARLDTQIKAVYNCDFKEYIGYLKGINASENGMYKYYIQYLESVNNTLNTQALTKPMGASIITGKTLFSPKEIEAQNIIKNLQDAIKVSKNKVELTDKLYTIKMSNAYVNAKLLNDPQIAEVLSIINSDENIGALLKKIKTDLNALAPEVAATIRVSADTIKKAGASYINIRNFYDEIAGLVLEKVKGISDADFKKYIIDQIFNNDKTVSELLAEFDSITMPALRNGLETMLQQENFKFIDYPTLEDQIAGVYRRFLEAQETAEIDTVSAVIVEDFTKSLDDLVEYMPQYAEELLPLTAASNQIKNILAETKMLNLDTLESVFTDKDTIFKLFNTRQLSDAGLALKTVALKQNLDLFDIPKDLSGNVVAEINRLGASIKRTKNSLEQYSVNFTPKKAVAINKTYQKIVDKFIQNDTITDLGAFKYIKVVKDPLEQFTQLIELNKSLTDETTRKYYKEILRQNLETTEYLNVLNPAKLMTTDFAWDAMAQSAWIAEKQFNEFIINGITAYRNLSLFSKKATNDFQAVRNMLSLNKLDRPKMLQQERYIKAASKINDMLEFLEQHYASRFNKTLADEEINIVRNVLLNFPELNDKYSNLVDRLDRYWHGELEFKQSPKYEKGQEDFRDTFTPFWEEINAMNQDIQETVQKYNNALYDDFMQSRVKFDKEEFAKRRIKFDKEELARRKVKFDKEELAKRQVFDKEAFKKRLYKFDKEEYSLRQVEKFDKELLKSRFKKFSIRDVIRTPDMSNAAFEQAVKDYRQQVKDYNNLIYSLYKADLRDSNAQVLQEYLQELTDKNNVLYDLYSKDIKPTNDVIYQEYIDELNQKNNVIFEEYVNELYAQNTPIYETYLAELDAINQKTYEDYLELRVQYKPITPWDPVKEQQELNKLISKATDTNAKGAFYNLFSLSPEDFINELAYRKRFITFNEMDIEDPQLKAMFNKFNYGNKKRSSTEFVDVYQSTNGWYSIHDKQNHRYWYILDKTRSVNMSGRQVYLNDKPIMRVSKKKTFNEFELVDKYINDPNSPGITKTLNELDDALETLTGSRLGDSQGEYLSKEALQNVYDQMPDEVKKLLPDFNEWTDKQFFNAYVFNESILGSAKSKRELGMYSANQIINTRNAIVGAQGYLKPKNEYVNAVFDSQLSISNPNSVWASFSDNDLLEALQANPEYKLVVLVDDKKYGMKTREILPTSVEAIKKAKEVGGWIIPTQTYKDMYNVVNHRLGSTGMAKLWSRIMYVYKFGYLCRPGAWIRNFIDTNIKSKLEMGDEFSSYKAQAHKILDDIDNMKKFVQARDFEGFIRSDAIKQWFTDGNAKYLTYEQYLELDRDFLSQGISGNIMADLYKTEGGDLWQTFTELTGNIVEAGNRTENYNRLAMYLYELDHGADYTTALSKLAKTHFDYSFKTKAEQLAEMVFPFATFSMRNYSYWIEMIEKHPWIMRNYVHLMKPHWDFKDYTPEELARDQRVQSQILYGQLKLGEFNNKVITFKANPSIQDAIQMFSDPINNVYEKLAAPIAAVRDVTAGKDINTNNLIPVVGPAIQAIQTMTKTGTPLPSAIGVQSMPRRKGQAKANGKWSNPNLSETDKYTDNTYRTPRYRKNIIYDSYAVKGVKRYRLNLYPIVDVAHDIKMRYSTNVYNRIKNRVQQDVYKGIRYRIRLDVNRFR